MIMNKMNNNDKNKFHLLIIQKTERKKKQTQPLTQPLTNI